MRQCGDGCFGSSNEVNTFDVFAVVAVVMFVCVLTCQNVTLFVCFVGARLWAFDLLSDVF